VLDGNLSKDDIESLINTGDKVRENEDRVIKEGRETRTYSYHLPESIRNNAIIIDRKLADITVCDPAVGSGAFPVGMMNEIVKIRIVLSSFIGDENRSLYEHKRHCIENSLYGVDIDPGAVEIAKLRLWLSLVVDEEDIKNIRPLPNLDYKILCGNSLLSVEKDLFNSELLSKLESLKPLFFNETNPSKKQEYNKQIDDLIIRN
ncbi:MAG: Eco57I restriction-modification methylase domain-containing protein, partial [Candidatus Hodarchaeales archaeon]